MFRDTKILVTGPAGQIAFPLAAYLAEHNEVWGLARFTDESGRARVEAAGVRTVACDLASGDFTGVPDDFDYVLHLATFRNGGLDYDQAMRVNAEGTHLLLAHCRAAKAALVMSTAEVYRPNDDPLTRIHESAPLGDSNSLFDPTYSMSKIAQEAVARSCARAYDLPVTIARMNASYGDNGGLPTYHLDWLLAGKDIVVKWDPAMYSPIHQDDINAQTEALLGSASVPATIVNWAGDESVAAQEWCAHLGELTGRTPNIVVKEVPGGIRGIVLDNTARLAITGPCTVSWREGLRRVVEGRLDASAAVPTVQGQADRLLSSFERGGVIVPLPDGLPRPNDERVAVRATKDALRQVRGGHPWLFAPSITSTSDGGAPGDLAVVFDDERKFAAIGLYDPSSPLRVRVLHTGRPVQVDGAFWQARIDAALERRAPLAASHATNAYRCIHGENDALPGLVLDRYDTTSVLRLDTQAWFAHLEVLVPLLVAATGAERLVLRLSRALHDAGAAIGLPDGAVLAGDAPPAVVLFRENGLVFEADVVRGQKTGHFLDQRDNRARVHNLAVDRSVLDVFSCTGGFTVHAAAGGARSVHSIDLSAHAIGAVRRNLAHNAERKALVRCVATQATGDAFVLMRNLVSRREQFDAVIIDPPSFASKQADVEGALTAYRRLTMLGVQLVAPGGTIVQSSCSSRVAADAFYDTVLEAATDAGRPVSERARTGHTLDHPVGFPQGAYLKTLFARVP